MIKFKSARLLVVLAVFLLINGSGLNAEVLTKVLIIPFSLNADKPNPSIQNKIPDMIGSLLKKEGAGVILLTDQKVNIPDMDTDALKKIGIENGADYILTGSLFVAGESISIDSNLINTFDETDQTSLFAQARDFENLYSAVSKISKEVTSIIFQTSMITNIVISGNERIEKDVILRNINTQAGDILKSENVSKDLKKIYSMGYFDNVVVKKESSDKGVKLIYDVTEKATVRRIKFKKNVIFDKKELEEVVNTRTGSILNIYKLKDDINRMRLMYTTKNYHNIVIDYEIIPLENSQADIVFTFNEGDKVRVEKITFEGNHHFSDKEIKKEIETSERGFFSFFTSSGDLNEVEVKNDVVRIESLYKNNGFIDAKVSDPIIDIGEKSIQVNFKISEGVQYKIKSIDITGDLIVSKEELFSTIQSKENELFNRELLRKDILAVTDIYMDKGYANANITPLVKKEDETHLMTVIYQIKKGEPVTFDRINISGNLKTRDKVIRRELKVTENSLYSKENIQKSFKNLNRLDFFEQIEVQPVDTNEANKKNLQVTVVEKQTGAFSVGGGFSSEKSGFFTASLQENNLFGRGQTGKISAEISAEDILYTISFFEPYILDTRVSGGFSLYKQEKEYDYYDKDSLGLSLSLGYKIFDYTKIGVSYNIEDFDIQNVQTASTNMTQGQFLASSMTPYISHDSRDDLFLPTEGRKHHFSIKYSGNFLGGDIDFIKYLGSTSFYFPLFWKFTGLVHGKAGYIDDQSGDNINIDYEKFYLGGMSSIRGFGSGDIDGTRAGETKQRGGEKFVQFNAELSFPLTEKYKMAGVLFYDRGDVYRTDEDLDFADQYSSAGIGLKWSSPVGPINVNYGWVIDGKSVKNSGDGKLQFSVGGSF